MKRRTFASGFTSGLAYCLDLLYRHRMDEAARIILRESGVKSAEFDASDIDPQDKRHISFYYRPEWAQKQVRPSRCSSCGKKVTK